jgi:hypothetical protein
MSPIPSTHNAATIGLTRSTLALNKIKAAKNCFLTAMKMTGNKLLPAVD